MGGYSTVAVIGVPLSNVTSPLGAFIGGRVKSAGRRAVRMFMLTQHDADHPLAGTAAARWLLVCKAGHLAGPPFLHAGTALLP